MAEADRLVRQVEERIIPIPGIESVFAFSGGGEGLVNRAGNDGPPDAIGQVQVELAPWNERGSGDEILANLTETVSDIPGIIAELALQEDGPQQGKPIQLEVRAANWTDLHKAAEIARAR